MISIILSRSHRFPTVLWLGLLLGILLPAGCDLLLGPDPKSVQQFTAQWEREAVAAGEIAGLDLAISDQGEILASYFYEDANIRVSRLEGGEWNHLEGPSVSSGLPGDTHLATGPGGSAAVLYHSGSGTIILPVGTALGTSIALESLEASRRDTLYPRPQTWTYESADLAFGSDGRMHVVVRGEADDRLWLFRQEASGWSLGIVPNSQYVSKSIDLEVYGDDREHIVFQANNQGVYYWWRPDKGWEERLKIPDSLPYLLKLRQDELSVLVTRDRSIVHVAEEVYDSTGDRYYWRIRTVAEDELLFWHNMDLVLDENGFPSIIYILYQNWDDQYLIWFTQFETDGTWSKALVASNLRLPYFNPFDVRMVREASGRIHILLTTGEVSGISGVSQEREKRLIHLYSDNPLGDPEENP